MKHLLTIKQANVTGKNVFVRVDFNVPVEQGRVADDRKIRETLPTLKYLLDQSAAQLTLATHFSDPSTPIDPVRAHFQELMDDPRITIRDNLRLDAREELNDSAFAKQLASGHDLYVNDAFGACHRPHASVVAITKFLPSYAGLLVEKEVAGLSHLLGNPERPFVVLIGGAKVKDKIGVIERMAKMADKVLVGGKTGIEFKAQFPNHPANVLPLVDDDDNKDVGPLTIELFKQELAKAKTVFWNGNMGVSEDPQHTRGTYEIARFLAYEDSVKHVKVYIGGGDTGKVVDDLGLHERISFISTGGGATLEFLASGGDLPGLRPLYR